MLCHNTHAIKWVNTVQYAREEKNDAWNFCFINI